MNHLACQSTDMALRLVAMSQCADNLIRALMQQSAHAGAVPPGRPRGNRSSPGKAAAHPPPARARQRHPAADHPRGRATNNHCRFRWQRRRGTQAGGRISCPQLAPGGNSVQSLCRFPDGAGLPAAEVRGKRAGVADAAPHRQKRAWFPEFQAGFRGFMAAFPVIVGWFRRGLAWFW